MTWADLQPKPGDLILVCGHSDNYKGRVHWLHHDGSSDNIEFLRIRAKDGKIDQGKAQWMMVCEDCFFSHENPADSICGEITWDGDFPIIEKAVVQ